MPEGTVLVTGGSGFIGSHALVQLLNAGWTVRTTVRSLKREAEVRDLVRTGGADPARLTFFAADLNSDAGWNEAVNGSDYVLHVASPFPMAQPRNDDELVAPARDGALRVLRASQAAGVKRVVLTSSMAAIAYGFRDRPNPLTEEHWTDLNGPNITPYIRSKTVAERAAWDFMKQNPGAMTLSVVNPVAVLGPVLGRDYSTSIQLLERLLTGSMPGLLRIGFPIVDVRDVADMHIRAMTAPEAAGERFLATGPFMWIEEVAAVLRERLGARAAKVPKGRAPSFVVRAMAMFDPGVRTIANELDLERHPTWAKAERLLGWKPRSNEEAIIDCAESLLSVGGIKTAA
jgi:nucleoside-diphosphate-sugar epimerase